MAVPEPVMLLGVIEPQVRPDGTVSVRLTVPVKLFCPVTVMVEVADWPVFTGAGEVAVIVKSEFEARFLTATLVLWFRLPLVPVTFTV